MSTDYDYPSADGEQTFNLYAGGFLSLPTYLEFSAYDDGINETNEGLLVYVNVLESQLDDRDRGEVSLERGVYLIRITPSRMLN